MRCLWRNSISKRILDQEAICLANWAIKRAWNVLYFHFPFSDRHAYNEQWIPSNRKGLLICHTLKIDDKIEFKSYILILIKNQINSKSNELMRNKLELKVQFLFVRLKSRKKNRWGMHITVSIWMYKWTLQKKVGWVIMNATVFFFKEAEKTLFASMNRHKKRVFVFEEEI